MIFFKSPSKLNTRAYWTTNGYSVFCLFSLVYGEAQWMEIPDQDIKEFKDPASKTQLLTTRIKYNALKVIQEFADS